MEGKLLWSWSIEDTRKDLNKYNIQLPDWMEYVAGALGLGGLLYIIYLYIFPMGSTWLMLVIGAPTLLLILFTTILGIKPKGVYGDGWYIKICSDEISFNLEDISGNYSLDNIEIDTLAVKYITYWGYSGPAPVKGLFFKTINPALAVKAPLIILSSRYVKELKQAINMLKQQNAVAAI